MIENIRLSLRGIWGHKMRSFLTMLGVIIGIASILAIVSIVEGTNRKLEKSLVGAGNNVTDVQVCQDGYPSTDSFQAGNMPGGIPTVSEASLEQIRSIEHVTNASLFYSRSWADSIYYQNKSSQNVSLLGVKPDYFTTCDYQLIAGRMMTEEEGKSARKVCILDEEQAENLFGTEPAVGKIIEIRKEPYTVIGVVRAANEEKKEYESLDEYHMDQWGSPGKIFVNYGSWPLIYVFDEPEGVAVQVDEAKNMAAAGAAAADILNMYVTNGNLTYQAVNTDEAAILNRIRCFDLCWRRNWCFTWNINWKSDCYGHLYGLRNQHPLDLHCRGIFCRNWPYFWCSSGQKGGKDESYRCSEKRVTLEFIYTFFIVSFENGHTFLSIQSYSYIIKRMKFI